MNTALRKLITTLAALVLVLLYPASASAAGAVQVRGLLVPDTAGVCTDHPAALQIMTVSGSLEGCWYIDTIDSERGTPSGGYIATGTETFVGCLGDACGEFYTHFIFTSKWAADGSETHGRCHHPIVGGTGAFAGVSGSIQMHDLPNGCAVYNGALKF